MENETLNDLIAEISGKKELRRAIFEAPGIFFIIANGDIWEISDDASESPRDGWFPEIFTGPSKEKKDFIQKLQAKIGFGDGFFDDYVDEMCLDAGDADADEVMEYFEDNEDEDALKTFKKINKELTASGSPYAGLGDFVKALKRMDLSPDTYYYEWEGEILDFYDSIWDSGDERGTYEEFSDEEWIDILKNIRKYVFRP